MPNKPTPEAFVRIWQASATLAEAAAALHVEPHKATARANYYRKKGVPLKNMKPKQYGRRNDWTALAALALELAPQEAEE